MTRIPSDVLNVLKPFEAAKQAAASWAYAYTVDLSSETIEILVDRWSSFFGASENALTFYSGPTYRTSRPPGLDFFCMETSRAEHCLFADINDIESEALFKRGISFNFRLDRSGDWRTFGNEHVFNEVPPNAILDRHQPTSSLWVTAGLSEVENLREAANDPLILKWWTSKHDELIIREIKQFHWAWTPPVKELISITAPEVIETFKREHPACKKWIWRNVIHYFTRARAFSEKFLADAAKPCWVICPLCQQETHQTRTYFFGSIDQSVFCRTCVKDSLWASPPVEMTPDEVMEYYRAISTHLGRIPQVNYGTRKSDFAGVPVERLTQILRTMRRKPRGNLVTMYFGNWFQMLVQSGILSGDSQQMERGIRSVASDGHLCLSLGERTVCDLLYRHGVEHEREVGYPSEARFRTDWKVGPIFIEYFGLAGNAEYDLKIAAKKRLAATLGIPLISLYPKDVADAQRLLKKLTGVLPVNAVLTELAKIRPQRDQSASAHPTSVL